MMRTAGITVGIDASRSRSGGAKAHLIGILTGADPRAFGISKVHLWAFKELADAVPDVPWLVKHIPSATRKPIWVQLWWQYQHLPREAMAAGCDVLFNTDAGSICPFQPAVTLSQDMLSYEPGEMQRYGFSKARLRLEILKHVQLRSLRRARGALFLTRYACEVIGKAAGKLARVAVIPHGIGHEFRRDTQGAGMPNGEIRCLYVSNTAMYKHQWHVVDAIGRLRARGIPVALLLVGGGSGAAQERLRRQMVVTDPAGAFIRQMEFVPHEKIPELLAEADIFIFASSCENMPITLLEGMAAGLPIASSDRGPMPEVLEDGGVYFDPEDPVSIVAALERLMQDPVQAAAMARRARELAGNYSWERCARETWAFLAACAAAKE